MKLFVSIDGGPPLPCGKVSVYVFPTEDAQENHLQTHFSNDGICHQLADASGTVVATDCAEYDDVVRAVENGDFA